MKPLIVEEEAELELFGSIAFYEERMSGLGLDFEAAMRRALKIIASASERWPIGKHGTRRYVMRRFPFIIHYLDCQIRFGLLRLPTRAENQIIGKKDGNRNRSDRVNATASVEDAKGSSCEKSRL